MKNTIKPICVSAVLVISFMRVYVNSYHKRIANETVNTSIMSIGQQSEAYCNEARYKNETNNGKCSGNASAPESRCTSSASGSACIIE